MERLVDKLSRKGEKILIPDPVLSEFLVTAVLAGASIQHYLKIIQGAQHFVTRPFGTRAAVEVAERLANAIKAGDKREGERTEPWQKLKFDRQIVAIAIVEGATVLYSTDRDVHNQGKRWGLEVISPADLPLYAVQLPLKELEHHAPITESPGLPVAMPLETTRPPQSLPAASAESPERRESDSRAEMPESEKKDIG